MYPADNYRYRKKSKTSPCPDCYFVVSREEQQIRRLLIKSDGPLHANKTRSQRRISPLKSPEINSNSNELSRINRGPRKTNNREKRCTPFGRKLSDTHAHGFLSKMVRRLPATSSLFSRPLPGSIASRLAINHRNSLLLINDLNPGPSLGLVGRKFNTCPPDKCETFLSHKNIVENGIRENRLDAECYYLHF